MKHDVHMFESLRPELLALAYRMLGDVGRTEDVVQEAWLRWDEGDEEVEVPRAYLATVVTRLCLNELQSARARLEESRSDRLPGPIHLDEAAIRRVEDMDRVSMAFLVVLQQLTPAERAALLLLDVFDFSHGEISELIHRSEAGCRQLLRRARRRVATERRLLAAPREEHLRLLNAFLKASSEGNVRGSSTSCPTTPCSSPTAARTAGGMAGFATCRGRSSGLSRSLRSWPRWGASGPPACGTASAS